MSAPAATPSAAAPVPAVRPLEADLAAVRDQVKACMQCGTCTASCPNTFAMDLTPRHMWRLVIMGDAEAVFQSHTFTLCSACYTCTLRCPRGLPLTDAMAQLKRVAARRTPARHPESTAFYRSFMDSVRRHGRVHEMEFISGYFRSQILRRPLLPLPYTSMGLRLMAKGKLGLHRSKGGRSLEAVFRKAESMEAGQ